VRVEASKDNTLVTDQTSGAIDWMRVAALDLEVRLATGDEEAARLVEAIEAREIEEATIHNVESARLRQQLVKDIDLVHLAITDVNERGDVAAQIEQRMQLDGCLGPAEHGPRKHRQTQIDGGGVERVDGFLQIDAEGLLHIQPPGDADQALGEIGVDAPVAHGVGIGQRVASHRRPNPEMIELGTLCTQAYFDVPKTLPVGQLCERHAQELIQAREGLHFELAPIADNAAAESSQRKMAHQLRKHQPASVHRWPPRSRASQGGRSGIRSSNRDQENSSVMRFSSTVYGSYEAKRWDTTVEEYMKEPKSDYDDEWHLKNFMLSHVVDDLRIAQQKRDPDSANNLAGMSAVGETEEGFARLREAIRVDALSSFAWFNLGAALGRAGLLQDSFEAYLFAGVCFPYDVEAWTRALMHGFKVIGTNPLNANLTICIARMAYRRNGQKFLEEVQKHFDKQDPAFPSANLMELVAVAVKDIDRANRLFEVRMVGQGADYKVVARAKKVP
jgi:hypothetical protein